MTAEGLELRLVATDLDGTILCSDGTLSARTRVALARLEEAGIELAFVTARPPRWMPPIARMTDHHGIAICANGAIVYDLHAERIIDSFPLQDEVAREVVRRMRQALPGVSFAVETTEGFGSEPGHLQHQWDTALRAPAAEVEELLKTPAVKLLIGHADRTTDELLAMARGALGELVELTHSSPDLAVVEVSAAGISKATTLARLCAAHGIAATQVLAFGDMPNDLPLLAWAGTAVAVANAHAEVLAAVPWRTASNDQDGVAQVLERLLELGTVQNSHEATAWT
jgi:Cof subfamily protein (haloacid dehalogenase superfamily)